MKIKHAIVAAAFLFMAGCETTGNTTGTGSTASGTNAAPTPSTAGISTSGTTNPASNATNARGTLTSGATGTEGTATGTNTSANNANSAMQNGTSSANTNANTSTINSASPSGATSGSFSVPSTYQSSFTTRYPGATNVQWSRYNSTDVPIDWEMTGWTPLDDNDYTVRYNIGADPYYAWYDSEGNWIGTAGAMKNTGSLPTAVNTLLSTKYKGYSISSANTEYWKDRTAYEIEMTNATTKVKLLVDANGNVLKEKTKMQ